MPLLGENHSQQRAILQTWWSWIFGDDLKQLDTVAMVSMWFRSPQGPIRTGVKQGFYKGPFGLLNHVEPWLQCLTIIFVMVCCTILILPNSWRSTCKILNYLLPVPFYYYHHQSSHYGWPPLFVVNLPVFSRITAYKICVATYSCVPAATSLSEQPAASHRATFIRFQHGFSCRYPCNCSAFLLHSFIWWLPQRECLVLASKWWRQQHLIFLIIWCANM